MVIIFENPAGLGSSAAFSVGSSTVFHLLRHIQSNQNIFVPNLELINNWAFQCEKMFHATPSGIDNAVCTFGGVVKYKKTVIGSVSIPESRVLLVNTGVGRQTKLLVEAVRKRRDEFPVIIDHILDGRTFSYFNNIFFMITFSSAGRPFLPFFLFGPMRQAAQDVLYCPT